MLNSIQDELMKCETWILQVLCLESESVSAREQCPCTCTQYMDVDSIYVDRTKLVGRGWRRNGW